MSLLQTSITRFAVKKPSAATRPAALPLSAQRKRQVTLRSSSDHDDLDDDDLDDADEVQHDLGIAVVLDNDDDDDDDVPPDVHDVQLLVDAENAVAHANVVSLAPPPLKAAPLKRARVDAHPVVPRPGVLKTYGKAKAAAPSASLQLFKTTFDSPMAPASPPRANEDAATSDKTALSGSKAWKALLSGDADASADDEDALPALRRVGATTTPLSSKRGRVSRTSAAAAAGTERSPPGSEAKTARTVSSESASSRKLEQTQLNVGQKSVAHVSVGGSDLLYVPGNLEDKKMIEKTAGGKALSLGKDWAKLADTARKYADGGALLVVHSGAPVKEKLAAVRRLMDDALGYTHDAQASARETLYVLVDKGGEVLGVCAVYPIDVAFALTDSASTDAAIEVSRDPWPMAVQMGVSRIWVPPKKRLAGHARRLLDGARTTFNYAGALSVTDLAFTQPTPDGLAFFKKYVGAANPVLICK